MSLFSSDVNEWDGYYQLSNVYTSFSRPVFIHSEYPGRRIKWVPNSWIIENSGLFTNDFEIISFDSSSYFPPTDDMGYDFSNWTSLIQENNDNSIETTTLSLECIATDIPTQYPSLSPSNVPTNNPTTTTSPTSVPTMIPTTVTTNVTINTIKCKLL